MTQRRVLSLWFPRLAAERALRMRRLALPLPFAMAGERAGAQVLTSLSAEAEAAGLRAGQPLRDAMAMCPALVTAAEDAVGDAAFLAALRRWAGKFSPWVAEEAPEGLVIDLTGCAHLFGGEAALLAQVGQDCADLGLTVRAGLADTPGAAWALARHGGGGGAGLPAGRNGDAIAQEAHATRSRAGRRRGGGGDIPRVPMATIAPTGGTRTALAGLPVAALRLPPATVEGLARLGLRRVADIAGLPRAALARRFGLEVLKRLDQAMGLEPEPVTPAEAPLHFATRITLPDPIGLRADVEAALDRILPPLCARLKARGRGARRLRLQAFRADGGVSVVEIGLARAADSPDRIRPILLMKLDEIDAGFGIDCLRIEAHQTEPLHAVQHRGHFDAAAEAQARAGADTALEDLVTRLGARLGSEAVIRLHPADSHIPERTATAMAAAWSAPHAGPWPEPPGPRPLVLFRPEPVGAPAGDPTPPARFRFRGRDLATRVAVGPERLLPEWWLDDPAWRSGPRDYWRVETEGGDRLWLYFAHGAEVSGGWFCQGLFA